jgi:hypothetical protein
MTVLAHSEPIFCQHFCAFAAPWCSSSQPRNHLRLPPGAGRAEAQSSRGATVVAIGYKTTHLRLLPL